MATSSSTAEAVPLSEGARLADTFIAPSKTFADLRRSAAWWGPFVVMTVVSLLFVSVVDSKIGFRKIFMIWTLVITAVGFATTDRIKRSTAMAVVFGWYIVFVLGSTALGAAFS